MLTLGDEVHTLMWSLSPSPSSAFAKLVTVSVPIFYPALVTSSNWSSKLLSDNYVFFNAVVLATQHPLHFFHFSLHRHYLPPSPPPPLLFRPRPLKVPFPPLKVAPGRRIRQLLSPPSAPQSSLRNYSEKLLILILVSWFGPNTTHVSDI